MSPFQLGIDEIVVEPGERYFIESRRNPRLLDINFSELSDNKLWSASKGSRYYKHLSNTGIAVEGIPEGWLELRTARGVQTITNVEKSSRSVRVRWSESVEFIFSLDVPADAEPGPYLGSVTLSSREGETTVPVGILVDHPIADGFVQAGN